MSSCEKGAEKLNVERALFIIKSVAIACGPVSIGCITCGILTLVYVSPNFSFPFSSGSGLWTGLVAFLICVFGLLFVRKYREDDPRASRCEIGAFYGLIVSGITCGSLHSIYSGIGLGYCVSDKQTNSGENCGDEASKLTIICAFNLVFGVFIIVTSISTMTYLLCGKKLHALSGWPTTGGCCTW